MGASLDELTWRIVYETVQLIKYLEFK